MTDHGSEPTVALLSGVEVSLALYDWVRELMERGHTIAVDADDTVRVQPPCHGDILFHLQASYSETREILGEFLRPAHASLNRAASLCVRR